MGGRGVIVRVFYKSGNSIDVECNDVEVTREAVSSVVTKIAWEGEPMPRAILNGLDNIEAVWVVKD